MFQKKNLTLLLQMDGINTKNGRVLQPLVVVIPLQMDGINTIDEIKASCIVL